MHSEEAVYNVVAALGCFGLIGDVNATGNGPNLRHQGHTAFKPATRADRRYLGLTVFGRCRWPRLRYVPCVTFGSCGI